MTELREAREPRMSRRQLSDALREFGINVTDRAIANWEHGINVPPATVPPSLARIFGIKTDDFFSDERCDGDTPTQQEAA